MFDVTARDSITFCRIEQVAALAPDVTASAPGAGNIQKLLSDARPEIRARHPRSPSRHPRALLVEPYTRDLPIRARIDEKQEGAEAPSSIEHTSGAQLIQSFTVSMLLLTHSSATSRGSSLSRPISRIH